MQRWIKNTIAKLIPAGRANNRLPTLLLSLSLTACSSSLPMSLPVETIGATAPGIPPLDAQGLTTAKDLIYLIKIPPNQGYRVVAAVDRTAVRLLPDFAQPSAAGSPPSVAVINGGYFDPQNSKTTAYVTVNGETLLDPRQNKDLMGNKNVAPYMSRILNRSEFRRYECEGERGGGGEGGDRYDITPHNAPTPAGCKILDALGAGPQLLPTMSDGAEAFYVTQDGQVLRDPLGRDRPNARSAIALTADGTVILAMVGQKPGVAGSGMTLGELTEFLQQQGAVKALNLDGGSSSSLWYGDHIYYGKLDDQGQSVQRPVKSVLKVIR